MKAVVVIPTYNEKDNIVRLLDMLLQVLRKIKQWKLELLIVDDNSPDGTAKVVESYKKKHKDVHLLMRQKKVGLGAAYLAGMDYSFDRLKADAIITMDADLSHNPKYLPKFIKHLEQGSDFVVGSRYVKGGSIPKKWAMHRKIYSVLGNEIASLLLGRGRINDWTSGFKAITFRAYQKVRPNLLGQTVKGYTFNMSLAYHTLLHNFTVSQVPINFIDRKAGKSKLGMEYLFYTPIFLVKTRLGK